MTLTVGSLFSGIGGLELGLERAGMKTVWQVECDEYARKVLEKHWPKVRRYQDVKAVHSGHRAKEWGIYGYVSCDDCLAYVDLICGGFPCQDISVAGRGAGLAGERSGLWSEFRRVIGEVRPRLVLVENVSALLVRGIDRVLGDLAALGYDSEWDCIPAAAVGAPHRRDRLFIVAHAQREFVRKQPESIAGSGREAQSRIDGTQGNVANTDSERLEKRPSIFRNARKELEAFERSCVSGPGIWATEPDVGRVADGVPKRVDRLRCLGNAVVPQVAEFIGRRIMGAA